MQRLIGLLRRVRERPPSGSASAPCAVETPDLQEKGRGGLHSAAASGDLAQLQRHWWWKRLRINKRDAKKQTPLHLACANGHTDVVRFLAGKKCQLNPRDNCKKSPLMKAVECQHKDCAAILLEHGANADLRGAGGNTALHLATIMRSKSLVELLLEHNAHVDAQNKLGYTPLAVAITEHCEEMVEFLLQKGADVHAQDNLKRTTLTVAVCAGDKNVIRLLLQHGADLSHEDIFASTPMCYASVSANADIPKQLEEYMGCERMGERSAGGPQGPAVLDSSCSGTTADFPLGTPALTRAGVLPAAGAEQEEDDDSPFDSETDSEGPRKVWASVKLPAARGHGVCAQSVAEERSNGVLPAAGAEQEEDDDSPFDSERWVRQLQQELADALKKNSLAEASLEAKKRYSRHLQEQKLQLQKELDRSKAKLQEVKEQCIRSECRAKSLKNAIKNKERELTTSRNLQGLLVASSGTAAIPELEERMQRLQVGKARLEATAQQQAKTIEALQKDLQASASAHKGLEDLITGLQTTRTAKEHQHQQSGRASKEVKKLAEMKCRSEALLDEMQRRNLAQEEERSRLKMLLEGCRTKLMAYAGRKRESQLGFQGEMKNSCSEVTNQVAKLGRKLEMQSKKMHAAGKIKPGPARKVVRSAWDSGRTRAEPGLNLRSRWETSMSQLNLQHGER
ncbi:uncharacterized protein LOC142408164 isoform X2 [Mycteria americana]|uniref:uncharacterized protein LOC142408164 isoform X2 n=1 Tax=Mycteria americana TaxID=33587 RepID=UPI003F59005A